MADQVEIRRSTRRRKTVQAYRKDGKTIVLLPATLDAATEQFWIERMTAKLDAADRRRSPDADGLTERAQRLNERYFGGHARPTSIRWVNNQQSRWGSCSVHSGDIRLSDRLLGMPEWVIDSVIVHELAHLLEPNHGPAFQALVQRYPKTDEAWGFLQGVQFRDQQETGS